MNFRQFVNFEHAKTLELVAACRVRFWSVRWPPVWSIGLALALGLWSARLPPVGAYSRPAGSRRVVLKVKHAILVRKVVEGECSQVRKKGRRKLEDYP